MSARKKIKKFTREFPSAESVKLTLETLRDAEGNDRSAAIISAALMEGALEKILIASIKRKESDFVRSLFENRGPLSDFHSKILVATAFDLITPQQAEELQILNSIRNAFAHSTSEITFDTPEVEAVVKELQTRQVVEKESAKFSRPMKLTNKKWYLLAVQILFVSYDSIYFNRTGTRLIGD